MSVTGDWSTGAGPAGEGPGGYETGAAPPADFGTPSGPPQGALAGFWIRFAAALIDGIILAVVGFILAALLGAVGRLLQYLVAAGYFTYFHSQPAGQSLGNKAVGIRVLSAEDGTHLDPARAFIRWLMSIVSAIPLALGYFWMLWDPLNQTWHDKVARSLVVKSSAYPPPQ